MAKVLIVFYSRSGNTRKMAALIEEGSRGEGAEDVQAGRKTDPSSIARWASGGFALRVGPPCPAPSSLRTLLLYLILRCGTPRFLLPCGHPSRDVPAAGGGEDDIAVQPGKVAVEEGDGPSRVVLRSDDH